MPGLTTNRDFYLAIGGLAESRRNNQRPLQEYLRALLGLAERHRDSAGLELSLFFELLSQAFDAPPKAVDPSWLQRVSSQRASGYALWHATLIGQIVDLVEMEKAGTLADEYRYFGIDAPRGGRWYNFDPCTFLECGTAGTIGGWEEGDPTGRALVPGQVAILDEGGNVTGVDPRDLDEPIIVIPFLSWEDLSDFLIAGQQYE